MVDHTWTLSNCSPGSGENMCHFALGVKGLKKT